MRLQVLDLDPHTYQPHLLHSPERNWTETNCWQDMMVEVLHALELEPLAACAFTLSSDFEGDQWTLFKFPVDELRLVYGLEVDEIYVWRPVVDHLEESLSCGRPLTVEVDAWFLPDTAGITYRCDHVKTGVVAQMLDREARTLGYFHNAGYFELSGEDFDGVFGLGEPRDPRVLFPYVEVVRLDRLVRRDASGLADVARDLTARHLARRPASNPMPRFRKRVESDLTWLAQNESAFHPYAFASCRQCGANAEVASAFVEWLGAGDDAVLGRAAAAFSTIAEESKRLQFALARAARGRKVDLSSPFELMEAAWDGAFEALGERFGT